MNLAAEYYADPPAQLRARHEGVGTCFPQLFSSIIPAEDSHCEAREGTRRRDTARASESPSERAPGARKQRTAAGVGTQTSCQDGSILAVLREANVTGVLTEAAAAHVDAVLADQATLALADTAAAGAGGVVLRVGVVVSGMCDSCTSAWRGTTGQYASIEQHRVEKESSSPLAPHRSELSLYGHSGLSAGRAHCMRFQWMAHAVAPSARELLHPPMAMRRQPLHSLRDRVSAVGTQASIVAGEEGSTC
eukprot:CAMPEP_0115849646 /NCGR_PEP_ID=MMETSP0287-20121206/11558_1 /TAXON_ID=412157 /ORGANISM="Chrysochromulina rotalis, Strain UIO044" /LENGTH=248 /DNA_ID=CAMNT_0003303623 /DNA_START=91 /DNA_END=836 /DNA_ORIENTATION=+